MKEKLTVNTLAFGNLKNRKKQYTSLIIGIILAMMFSSAIPLLFSSMLTSVKEMECDLYGRQNGIYVDAQISFLQRRRVKRLLVITALRMLLAVC